MPASAKALVTRATWSTETPLFISVSRRSEATSRPPLMAMQPLSASCRQSCGVKVFSKRMLPHQLIASRRRCSSAASAFSDFGGAASSTK